jgi:putative membrane protein
MMGSGFGLGFGIFGFLFMLIFWGGLILLAVWLVRALFSTNASRGTNRGGSDQSAQQILDQRYARGEISREQYDIMKQDLYGKAQNSHHRR